MLLWNAQLFIVMELLRGGDLYDLVCDHGPQTEADVIKLLRGPVLALSYLHAQGIVHR